MGRLDLSGLAELSLDLEEMAALPETVLEEMLTAEARVVEQAQREKGLAYGVHRTGVMLGSIRHGKMKQTNSGRAIYVTPQGKNAAGVRNAEVAFLNEYGKQGCSPRPFIRGANETCADKAVEAAEKVYTQWLESHRI